MERSQERSWVSDLPWLVRWLSSCYREHREGTGWDLGWRGRALRAGEITSSFWEDIDGTSRGGKRKGLDHAFDDLLPLAVRKERVDKHSPSPTAL